MDAPTLTTPPVGEDARIEAGTLLRRLLRINDGMRRVKWRTVYRIDEEATTPASVIDLCRRRLWDYDHG